MRMLEIFTSEKTYHPVIPDACLVTSFLEQILHYMVPKGQCYMFSHFSYMLPSLRMCYYWKLWSLAVFIYTYGAGHHICMSMQHDLFTRNDGNYLATFTLSV